jgi:uncharacterized protein YndB with AHSA1/START domain
MNDFGILTGPRTLRLERILPGPIEHVWRYLVDSDKRGEWLAAGEMEPRVGGKVELHFNHASLTPHLEVPPEKYRKHDGKSVVCVARVLEWEPPKRLAISWPTSADRDSNVTFELEPAGSDKVRLIITHRNLANRAELLSVAGGWHVHAGILVDKLNGRVPQPFWSEHTRLEKEYDQRLPPE